MKRVLSILMLAAASLDAQCVMCFRTAAAQQVERARVLNAGILIMLIPPVAILAGFIWLLWRRNNASAHDRIDRGEELYPMVAGAHHAGDGAADEH
jgi:hypothetical protein